MKEKKENSWDGQSGEKVGKQQAVERFRRSIKLNKGDWGKREPKGITAKNNRKGNRWHTQLGRWEATFLCHEPGGKKDVSVEGIRATKSPERPLKFNF